MNDKEAERLLRNYEKAVQEGKRVTFREFVQSMEREKPTPAEKKTRAFFGRPANIVVSELSGNVYEPQKRMAEFAEGKAKIIRVPTPVGETRFKITLAEAYSGEDAIRVWQRARLEKLRSLLPGGIIAFRF